MAIVLVLLSHTAIPLVGNGGAVGVAIFFTLSGFLITSLLLAERHRFGSIKVLAFYRRRFLRLVPAMVVCVAAAMIVSLVTIQRIPDWSLIISTLTYTSNWVMIGDFPTPTSLGHTWSLAIEEQFYLVWPLVLIAAASLSRKRMIQILLVACVAVLALRALLWDGGAGESRIYFGSDTRSDGLLFGAAVAFMLHGAKEVVTRTTTLYGSIAVLAMCCFIPGAPKAILMPTVAGIATATLIYSVVQGRGFFLLELAPVRWIGQRSYGMYLYQAPINVFVIQTWGHSLWLQLIVTPATFLAAYLSYKYVEGPFSRIKDRDPRSHKRTEIQADSSEAVH